MRAFGMSSAGEPNFGFRSTIDFARVARRRSVAIPGVAETHVAETACNLLSGRPADPGPGIRAIRPTFAGAPLTPEVLHRTDFMFTPASSGPQPNGAGHMVWFPPGRAQCAQPLQRVSDHRFRRWSPTCPKRSEIGQSMDIVLGIDLRSGVLGGEWFATECDGTENGCGRGQRAFASWFAAAGRRGGGEAW